MTIWWCMFGSNAVGGAQLDTTAAVTAPHVPWRPSLLTRSLALPACCNKYCCCARCVDLYHQIGDADKMKAACSSQRACVTSFPTTEVEDVLYAWLEAGPEAEKEAAANPPFVMPEQVGAVYHQSSIKAVLVFKCRWGSLTYCVPR